MLQSNRNWGKEFEVTGLRWTQQQKKPRVPRIYLNFVELVVKGMRFIHPLETATNRRSRGWHAFADLQDPIDRSANESHALT
jgi:hypothetical protein